MGWCGNVCYKGDRPYGQGGNRQMYRQRDNLTLKYKDVGCGVCTRHSGTLRLGTTGEMEQDETRSEVGVSERTGGAESV